jgi:PAS domain S-box-containing protein
MTERAKPNLPENDLIRLLIDSVCDYAIFLLDATGHVRTWNAGARLIKGYEAHEIIGQHFSRFYPPEAVKSGWPEHELKVAAATGRFEDEGWRVRKDGTLFWANIVITALRDSVGTLLGFGKVTRDLTHRRENEESLRHSEERFRLLVEGVSEYAIFMLDPNGHVVTWNSGAQRIKGYEADEIIGQHFRVFYPQDAVESKWPEHELLVAAETGRFADEGWRLRKDGSRFWASVVITALRDDEGRLRGFAKLTRDLSERKQAEEREASNSRREELLEAERSARIEAQRAARMKDEFLSTLSHELRTPLNAILGWSQILRRESTPKAQDVHRGVEVIERNARAQVRLIDDLLDVSRIMSGRMRLDVQQVALIDVVRAAVDSVEPAAHNKSIRLEVVLDPAVGIVSGDPSRLQQVFWNLLSNSIKFTPKGGKVQVLLQRVNSRIEVTVTDNGIGIPAEFIPHVFDRFSQRDSSTSRQYNGLGVGLAISKQLVELHGGSITARSAGEGQGAIFTVTLPISLLHSISHEHTAKTPTVETLTDTTLPGLEGVRVLLVDDEADALDVVRRLLESRGATVATASSAKDALEILATSRPDVLVSDIGMPAMDGFEFMRRIREREVKGERIPAIALTAFARTEDRKRAILSGYQAHVAKPFDTTELIILVAGLAGKT